MSFLCRIIPPLFVRQQAPQLATPWPNIGDENAAFNDEGTASAGWTATNATLSVSSSYLRQTKTAGGSNSSMSTGISFTPTGRDWILYGRARTTLAAGTSSVIWLLNGSREASLWFGTSNGGASLSSGAVSLVGTTGASTRNVASVGTGLAYDTTPVEFALQFDSKFGQLACWFREADGRWKFRARVACDWFSSSSIACLMGSGAPAGSWIEFDYLTLCRPNVVAIGDSLCAGATLFNPDRAFPGSTNDDSTWQRHANIYPASRNNLIVNKGVGSQSSVTINSRISEAAGEGARVVILHASSNDSALGVDQATRTASIQASINSIVASGATPVLLNAVYGTSSYAGQPSSLRDYMRTWWDTHRLTLSGSFAAIDTMQPLLGANNYMDAGLTQTDGIHPNTTGYAALGAHIKAMSGT